MAQQGSAPQKSGDSPLRVAYFSNVFQGLGGVQSALQDHHAHDAEFGLQSRFVVLWEEAERVWPGVQFLGWNRETRISRARRSLQATLSALPPADLHVFHTEWGWPFYADLLGDTRRILYVHNDFPGIEKFLPTRVWAVDGLIVVSSALAERVLKWRPDFPPERILQAACPIDPPVAALQPRQPRAIGAPLRIGFCGRMSIEQKRVDRFPEMVRALDAVGTAYTIDFLGDGDYRRTLENQLPDRNRFRFLGRRPRSEVWAAFAGWDVMVFTSDYEGTPLAMLEGMAAGVLPIHPALNSGGDAFAAAIHPRLVYPAGDIVGLAESVRWAAGLRPEEVDEMQTEALRLIEPQRPENARGKVIDFYRRITQLPPLARQPMNRPPPLTGWLTFGQYEPLLNWTKRFRK